MSVTNEISTSPKNTIALDATRPCVFTSHNFCDVAGRYCERNARSAPVNSKPHGESIPQQKVLSAALGCTNASGRVAAVFNNRFALHFFSPIAAYNARRRRCASHIKLTTRRLAWLLKNVRQQFSRLRDSGKDHTRRGAHCRGKSVYLGTMLRSVVHSKAAAHSKTTAATPQPST
jgi:hypothetical protein